MTTLANLSIAALVALHNTAVIDYAPEGFGEVAKFKSKAQGVAAIDALCAAGNLAIAFDGDTATIIDAMEAPNNGEGGDVDGEGEGDTAPELNADGGEGGDVDGEGDGEGEGEAHGPDAFDGLGDGKGKARNWGFVTASDAWLEANPRGSEAREEYRKARRKAARMNRKAERAAKEAAQDSANA